MANRTYTTSENVFEAAFEIQRAIDVDLTADQRDAIRCIVADVVACAVRPLRLAHLRRTTFDIVVRGDRLHFLKVPPEEDAP